MVQVSLFLLTIVLANLAAVKFGQIALIPIAFFLIPFDLVTRDLLQQRWQDNKLLLRLFLLIAGGGLLTLAINPNAKRIAIASCSAFVISMLIDSAVYQILIRKKMLVRMNVSNFFSAAVDSIIFPLIAFASINPWYCVGQAAAKFVGGFFWSLTLCRWYKS